MKLSKADIKLEADMNATMTRQRVCWISISCVK